MRSKNAFSPASGWGHYTSPTHTVRAFAQALAELTAEGGVPARAARYRENHELLVVGMIELGFAPLIAPEYQSTIITAFLHPHDPRFQWESFYSDMKSRGFALYPGKISSADTFRIGNIGHVFPADIRRLLANIRELSASNGWRFR